MKFFVASDHGGVTLKAAVKDYLAEKDFSVVDLGTSEAEKSTDYPDNADDLVQKMLLTEGAMGVLICGTGIGVAIRANRYKGIRAALVHNDFTAEYAKAHNDANVICFGARVTTADEMRCYMDIFLNTDYEGGRHDERVRKLDAPLVTKET
jgi:ribose 5-phosphate isomerase B